MQNWEQKKKKRLLFPKILGRSENGKQTFIFFRPNYDNIKKYAKEVEDHFGREKLYQSINHCISHMTFTIMANTLVKGNTFGIVAWHLKIIHQLKYNWLFDRLID